MRRAAGLLVLVLLALVAWLVLGHEPGTPRAAPGRPDTSDAGAPVGSGVDDGAPPAAAASPSRVRKHASIPRPTEPPPAAPETTAYTLRVVTGDDTPVPGVAARLDMSELGTTVARATRSDGRATWDVPENAGVLRVSSPLFDPVELQASETVVRLDDLLPLEIRFVDQESGHPLAVWIEGSPLESDDVTSHRRLETYTPRAAPVRAGRDTRLALWFGAPDGYVALAHPGHPVTRKGFVSRYASSVRTTVPVAREIALRVQVLRHDGSAAAEATVSATVTGDFDARSSAVTAASGEAFVRGLPFLRGERLAVHAADADDRTSPTEEVLLVDADREVTLTVRLPEHAPNGAIGIGGGASSSFRSRSRSQRPKRGTCRLAVTVTRRNGLPASGAIVLLRGPYDRTERADDRGHVAFADLPAGSYRVTLREPGIVATTEEVVLTDGEARTIAVREAEGRDATVRVLDADGLPLPNVRVHVDLPWGARHVQITNGVQDLDHWTDVSGRVRFTGLPPGAVTVAAKLGSRAQTRKLEGATLEITLPSR